MNFFIRISVCACMIITAQYVAAQKDTIYLSSAQVEDIFMEKNLQLIIERLNIDKAEAAVVQAKLWPNPTFTIDQVNLWTTEAQLQDKEEVIPPLFGSFGKNREFTLGIDQVILMGGKHGKLIDMEKVSKETSIRYFEELLCNLKAELRSTCAELRYAQQYRETLDKQQLRLEALIGNYREQSRQGNISQSQILRLQAELLDIESEINEVQKEVNAQLKKLKTLLNSSTTAMIFLTDDGQTLPSPDNFSFERLMDMANTTRPDLKRAALQTDYFKKSLRYEKAQRVPDITLHAAYDRGGGVVPNYVGFGISVDLPFFNRNQGAIKRAAIEHRQSLAEMEFLQTTVNNEVVQALENYRAAYRFTQRITGDFISNLEEIQENYTRNFINKNIGIVEFLDFFNTYRSNKRQILAARKEARICFEELQLTVGTEIN